MMTSVCVRFLTAEGCHYCADARQVLERLGRDWALRVEEVPLHSAEGADMALRDGIAFPPGVYLNGALFGYGRLSEGKLRRPADRRRLPAMPAVVVQALVTERVGEERAAAERTETSGVG